jgi:hypothetical protein
MKLQQSAGHVIMTRWLMFVGPPEAFKSILRILLGPDQAQPYEDGLQEVRPYQLQAEGLGGWFLHMGMKSNEK